jgi:16S rRNA (cytosine1402-N4)-methyltransferase
VSKHISVLYKEVLDLLQPHNGGLYIDGTVGAGGHATGLLILSAPEGRVLGFDRDPEAIAHSRAKLKHFDWRIVLVNASYAEMGKVAPSFGFDRVDGILLDLGLSSRQLADDRRGFSFMNDGPLDMRFDPNSDESAADLVNNLSEAELVDLFWRYGEVRQSRRVAKAIVRERPIHTTRELAGLIVQEVGRHRRIHPATQVFQALRIAVNQELVALAEGLEAAITSLKPGGRLAVISFHSLEDRQVKRFIREKSRDCICPPEQPICNCDIQPVLRAVKGPRKGKLIRPSEAELSANPRSRSARLRVSEKIAGV